MTAIYTESSLKQMKGQAVKDIWHGMIGKPAGIKNTTGLKNGDEIIRAILEGQQNPEFLRKFLMRAPKQTLAVEEKEMPPKPGKTETTVEKKKPGPKPKASNTLVTPVVPKKVSQLQAYESTDIPVKPSEITRISVKKLFVGDTMYFLDSKTNNLYENAENKPGTLCGRWCAETRSIHPLSPEA